MRIALTGGIAGGKSSAARLLGELGAHVLSADEAARRAVEPGSEGLEGIVREFGEWVLDGSGGLDRKKLAGLVFNDGAARERLNALLHPIIKRMLIGEAERIERADPFAAIVLEVPLLIESGWQDIADVIWVVTAGEEQRIARVMRRDGATRHEAVQRLAAQLSDGERVRFADAVIDNSGSEEELRERIAALYAAAAGEYEEKEARAKERPCRKSQVDKADGAGAGAADAAHGAVHDSGG